MNLDEYDPILNPPLEDLMDKPMKERPHMLMNNIAKITSWVFVPIMCPVYGMLLIFNLSLLKFAAPQAKLLTIGVIFGLCMVVPSVVGLLLKYTGVVSDVGLNKQNERFIPYVVVALCMLAAAWFVHNNGAPIWCPMFFVGGAVGGVINCVINFWWKISAHGAGVAGLVALLLRLHTVGMVDADIVLWTLIAVFVCGFLGFCRVYQRRHTAAQIFGGFAVGFGTVYGFMFIN